MAAWKENKTVGIVAAVVVVISIAILTNTLVKRQRGVPITPEMKAAMEKDMQMMKLRTKR